MRKWTMLGAAASALVLAGCSGAGSTREAEARLCAALDELQEVLAGLPPMTPATTAEQVRGGLDRVRSGLGGVYEAARALDGTRTDRLEAAFGGLEQVVQPLPDGAALEEKAAVIQVYVGDVERARGEMERLHCVPAETAS